MNRDKIKGMFYGIAIGDALGMPVEMESASYIREKYGRIETYRDPGDHKYFKGWKPGTWTDDTALTLAVADAFVESGKLDMDVQVKMHVQAIQEERGWGKSTREAILRLKNGVHWSESGKTDVPGRGVGNGVVMKIAPLAALKNHWEIENVVRLAKMTHNSGMAVSSALAHIAAVYICLKESELPKNFVDQVVMFTAAGRLFLDSKEPKDDLTKRLMLLKKHEEYTTDQIIKEFKGGPYVFESLPFSYMFFMKNPLTIDCLYDVVSAGGDTDSNGSLVGGLLGALHGVKIFPQSLIDGLLERDRIDLTVSRFCHRFCH